MKSLLIIAVMAAGAMSFAAPSSPDVCQIKINGAVTPDIKISSGQDSFYGEVANLSRTYGCLYSKIDGQAGTGRVYANGRLLPAASGKKQGLTVKEAEQAMHMAGVSCNVVSCIKIYDSKDDRNTQPVQVPTVKTVPSGVVVVSGDAG